MELWLGSHPKSGFLTACHKYIFRRYDRRYLMLIDDLRSNNYKLYELSEEQKNEENDLFDFGYNEVKIINANNVAEYIHDWIKKYGNSEEPSESYTNEAPPFPIIWYEWNDRLSEISYGKDLSRRGALVKSFKNEYGWERKVYHFHLLPENKCYVFCVSHSCIDSLGQLTSDKFNEKFNFDTLEGGASESNKRDLSRMFLYDLLIIAMTTTFMHCKNTQLIEAHVSEKLQKSRLKKRKLPLLKHYTLEISPVKKILKEQGNIEKTGIKQAMHICRGHFKDYRDGRGLFGKYQGLYWWEDQVRGDKHEGIIVKNYKVNAAN
jgi:hypothetical protein